MSTKDKDLEWQELQSDWMKVQVPQNEKESLQNRLNAYFATVKRKERLELIELFFDLILGGLVIWFAVDSLIETFTFWWPLPTEEMIASYESTQHSISPENWIKNFYGMLVFGIGILIIGMVIPFLSIKFRTQILKSNPIYEMSSKSWVELYLNNKIKQTQIGKFFAISYFLLFTSVYLYFRVIREQSDNLDSSLTLYSIVLSGSFWFLFPVSIYILSEWQKRKHLRMKRLFIEDFS